jgi:uncharacterized protein DUF922
MSPLGPPALRRIWRIVLVVGSIMAAAVPVGSPADDAQKTPAAEPALRKYAEGPLGPADFRGTPPDPLPINNDVRLLCMTYTQIRYTTRNRWEEKSPGNFVAHLTRCDCFAVVERPKSWNTRPSDLRLLDHEQGHFDISEIHARLGQQKLDQLLSGPGLLGHGRDETSAVADLDQKVRDLMKEIFDTESNEQLQYDRLTRHGRDPTAQAEQRRLQRERLKELEPKQPEATGKAKTTSR